MLVVHNSGEVIHIIHSSIHKAQVSKAFRRIEPAFWQLSSYQPGVVANHWSVLGVPYLIEVRISP